jgi:putative phosphoesterase
VRIAVLSDTHLRKVSIEFQNLMDTHLQGVDLVVHAGDWVGSAVLDFLEGYPLVAVSGNMDDTPIRERLPYKRVLQVNGFKLGLIHGWGTNLHLEERVRGEFEGVDAIIYGHSHRPTSHWRGDILYFNPGSVSQNRGVDYNTMGYITLGQSIETEIIKL